MKMSEGKQRKEEKRWVNEGERRDGKIERNNEAEAEKNNKTRGEVVKQNIKG